MDTKEWQTVYEHVCLRAPEIKALDPRTHLALIIALAYQVGVTDGTHDLAEKMESALKKLSSTL